ncbi:glycoside hydrolase family 108 protein [Acinetobacter sp. CE-15]|uniref:glycoside hydrolase family 108 protein n=1 Tax=Acinetobacter sp. CE-15 TaxID=3425693 RepID=UPI003DA61BE8
MNFEKAFARLIGHEGGYSTDRNDPGNWTGGKVGKGVLKGTKYGIAANTYPNLDIKNLTLEQAKAIYKKDWWDKLGAEQLHPAIVYQLWDFAVNAGKSRAVKELQQVAGVIDDGILGAKTIAAVKALSVTDVLILLTAERLRFYTSLTTWGTYGKGWTNRVADNLKYAVPDMKNGN